MAYNFREISVLIVDSQPALVDLIRGALRLLGVPPESLYSYSEGRMGLSSFKEKKPDLLILDWEMVDIKGLDFIKAIRNSADNPYVPIIFMTALTTQKKVVEARDCGITEFLAKPFTARTLCDRIEAIVEKPRKFVLALDYRGPDRRRRKIDLHDPERRDAGSTQNLKMSDIDVFKTQKKLRTAGLVTPPNILKQKMGSGGVDTKALVEAQKFLESNTVDFKPIGIALANALDEGMRNAKKDGVDNETGIELMLYPAAQLKAQGGMFHFPFLTRIADILVTFLETVEVTDKDVFEIVEAHKVAFLYILNNHITGDGGVYGNTLQGELLDACSRYYKTRNLKP